MKILITGGASGLGEAITRMIAKNSSNSIYVTFNGSRESALLLKNQFPTIKCFHVDFSSSQSISHFIEEMSDLDPEVLINNALTGFSQNYFHKLDEQLLENSFKHNVMPVISITKKFISERRKRRSGRIITILTSALINKPPVGWSEYVANKAYLHSMAKSWAVENASFGITSNCISPSFMVTNLTKSTDDRVIANMIDGNPNKTLLKEHEVAEAVSFFINASPHINGANLVINAAQDLV